MSRYLLVALGLAVSWGGVSSYLWLEARDDVAIAIQACNADTLEAALNRTREALKRSQRAVADRNATLRQLRRQQQIALQAAEDAAEQAISGTAEREARIRQLEQEAEFDENAIPDSQACLNAFVLNASLDRLSVPAADCDRDGIRGNSGPGAICADSGATDAGNSAAVGFAPVTYGDVLVLWGRERDSVEVLNGRLRSIRALSGRIADGEARDNHSD